MVVFFPLVISSLNMRSMASFCLSLNCGGGEGGTTFVLVVNTATEQSEGNGDLARDGAGLESEEMPLTDGFAGNADVVSMPDVPGASLWGLSLFSLGTLRYGDGDADALKYATVEESLGRVHSVRGGKIKLRFVASDATIFSSSIWLLSGKLENCCVQVMQWALLLMQNSCCSMRKARQIIWIFLTKSIRDFLCRTKMEPSVQPI